jgi:hypothetical protein
MSRVEGERTGREGLNKRSLTSERRVKRCKESRKRGNPAALAVMAMYMAAGYGV